MSHRSLGHRAPLLWLVLPYLAGLAAGRCGPDIPPALALAPALAAALLSLAAPRRLPRLWMASILASMLLAGCASFTLHQRRLPDRDALPVREAALEVRLDRVFPAVHPGRISGIATIVGARHHLSELAGQRIYVSLALHRGQSPPARSAVVAATGLLAGVPRRPPAGSFEAHLADLGVNFQFTRGRVTELKRPPSPYRQFCERLALRMNVLLAAGLEHRPDVAAVYRAMMLGQKHDLEAGQRELFLHSGTMHLFAINGLHIGVVAVSLHALLALLRCPRQLAGAIVLAILWLDVDTTGASPSAVRAFLMTAMIELALILRRPGNPIAALTAAALAVLLLDPLDFFSASFQMSYGVVTAILCLGLPLAEWLPARFPAQTRIPEAGWTRGRKFITALRRRLLGAVGVGAAASLASAVTGIEFFGLVAPCGLVANLLVAPLAMLVIVAGFLSLAAGIAGASGVSIFINGAASVLLRSIAAMIRLGLQVPEVCFSAHFRAPWIGPSALAALLAACLAGYAGGWNRGGWWPPFAVVALVLVIGVKFGVNLSP